MTAPTAAYGAAPTLPSGQEAMRLTRLTDALLTLARLGSGELVPRETAVALAL